MSYPLSLAARELTSLLADMRLEALWQLLDPLPDRNLRRSGPSITQFG